MIENQPIHILNQMGVIVSFSIAKKMTGADIKKFFSLQKKAGKKGLNIEKILKTKILNDIRSAIAENKIPGILTPQELAKETGIDHNVIEKIPELNKLIVVVAHKLAERKYGKMPLCYFINSIVNLIGLTEKDFEKFHNQNNDEDDDGDDSEIA
jgi:hypothetical protein